jgi:hypothetical protein
MFRRPPTRQLERRFLMRAETQTLVDEIKQAIALLRRHL